MKTVTIEISVPDDQMATIEDWLDDMQQNTEAMDNSPTFISASWDGEVKYVFGPYKG